MMNESTKTMKQFSLFSGDCGYIIFMANISKEQLIFLAVAYRATNLSAIAWAMGVAPQNLHRKINRNTLKKEELCKIGKILGGKYISCFSFPDGVIIGDKVLDIKSKTGSNKPQIV